MVAANGLEQHLELGSRENYYGYRRAKAPALDAGCWLLWLIGGANRPSVPSQGRRYRHRRSPPPRSRGSEGVCFFLCVCVFLPNELLVFKGPTLLQLYGKGAVVGQR